MKILAIIPARAGSKRLPGKNIKLLGGKPLIQWSIEGAFEHSEIVDCLVTTDSKEIADISRSLGAFVPWLRPHELATDTSLSIDVVLHAVEWYQKNKGTVDGVLLLQPTSPFRSYESLNEAFQKFSEYNFEKTILSFSRLDYHPYWTFYKEGEFMKPIFSDEKLQSRSQDLPFAYRINGSIYLVPTKWLMEKKSLYTKDIIPIFAKSAREEIDIDTLEDLLDAEKILTLESRSKL